MGTCHSAPSEKQTPIKTNTQETIAPVNTEVAVNNYKSKQIATWDVNDVFKWLSNVHNGDLSEMAVIFQQHKINGYMLDNLDMKHYLNTMNIPLGDQLDFQNALKMLKYSRSKDMERIQLKRAKQILEEEKQRLIAEREKNELEFKQKMKKEREELLAEKQLFEQEKQRLLDEKLKRVKIIWEWLDAHQWHEYDDKTNIMIEDLKIDESHQHIFIDNNHRKQTHLITKQSFNTALCFTKTIYHGFGGEVCSTHKVRRIEKISSIKQLIIDWKWKDNDGQWCPYDDTISNKIEQLNISESYLYAFHGNNQNYEITKKSMNTAIQINRGSMMNRDVQRFERYITKQCGSEDIMYPKWWDYHYDDYVKPKLITLDLNTFPGQEVVRNFNKTVKNRKVIKVEAVQNQMLYDSFWNDRKKLIRLIGEENINEMDVFHGTKIDIMRKIQIEGFRKEFNSSAVYGYGTYFAGNAKYSVGYSCSDYLGIFRMFQCKVLMGQSIRGYKEYALTNWPKKTNGLIYDSLVDDIDDPSIFVIHENARAYPMFVIHFK